MNAHQSSAFERIKKAELNITGNLHVCRITTPWNIHHYNFITELQHDGMVYTHQLIPILCWINSHSLQKTILVIHLLFFSVTQFILISHLNKSLVVV